MVAPLRLEQFMLEKYGPYADRTLEFRHDAALHIVLGRNEAGKSVTLRALTDLFCGFPGRIDSEDFRVVRFKSGELRLGATLLHADGRTLAFRRRAGRANTLLSAQDGEAFDEGTFREFAGIPERIEFESAFGLTAQALRAGGEDLLKVGGKLAETLAASSGQLSVLNPIRGILQDEAAELFYASGRKRKLNEAIDRYLTAGKELRASVVTSEALNRARETLGAAQAHSDNVKKLSKEIEMRRTVLERARRTRGRLRERTASLAALENFAALPDVDEATLASWLSAVESNAALTQQIAELDGQARALHNEAAALHLAPDLLANADVITGLIKSEGAADSFESDLPKREDAARGFWHGLERAAQSLELADANALIECLPTEMALARVRELLKKRADITSLREAAAIRLETASVQRRVLEQSGPPHVDDPAPLLRAFQIFDELPSAIRTLGAKAAEIAEETAKLEREAQRLWPTVPLADLLRLPLPEPSVIDKEASRARRMADTASQIGRDVSALAQHIVDTEKSMLALARDGAVASPEEMRAARRRRDEAVDNLEISQERDPRESGARFASLRWAISDADRHADGLLNGAERAERRRQLVEMLAKAQEEQAAIEARRAENADQQKQFEADWRALWSACSFAPLMPEAMRDWRNKAARIVEHYESLSATRATFLAAKNDCDIKAAALAAFAPRAGLAGIEGDGPVALHARIRDALTAQQKTFIDGREHEAHLVHAANDIAAAEKEIAALDERSASLAPDWTAALTILALEPDASMVEAEAAAQIWADASEDLNKFRYEDHRVTTIRQQIEVFEARAAELCARFCPDITGETPRRIVDTLTKRLEAARAASVSMQGFAAQQAKLARKIEAHRLEQSAAQTVLAAASVNLAHGGEELAPTLTRLGEQRNLQRTLAELNREIANAGDGLSPEQLEAEQQGLDFDAIGAEIAALDAQKTIALKDVGDAAIAEDSARKALAELEAGRDAAGHAVEKAEAAAEVQGIARDWLIRMGAAKLAAIAIERHRQRNQDPVITTTSDLFARATGAAFSGVVISYDSGDQPVLMGQRVTGEHVGVEAMSEGTRDQLFLSLRLALLAQRSGEPLPFIGDDLLASFDDVRTAQALDMLADFGATRQAILFTHHRHVVDIAEKRLGNRVQVLELSP